MIPNKFWQEASKAVAGGWAGGLALRSTGDGFSFPVQVFHDAAVFGLILALVSVMFWLTEVHMYPTEDSEDEEQPSDLPLFLQ